jgi:UTP-glucose-1-phosphate uridylyltransferase
VIGRGVLLVEDVVGDQRLLVLLVDDLVGLALSECVVDVLDGFEADGLGVPAHVQEQLLRLHVHQLSGEGGTKVRFRWCSNRS